MRTVKCLVAGAAASLLLAVPGLSSAQIVNNAVSRVQLNDYVSAGGVKSQDAIYAHAGQRILAKMAGGNFDPDLYLYVSVNGIWYYAATSTGGTANESIDYNVNSDGWYQVRVKGYSGSGNFVTTTDLTWDRNTRPSTCFGASGPDCAGDVAVNGCYHYYDGTVSCYTTVGSQKHDTCCANNTPNAIMCGGDNSASWACQGEWDRAWDDRQWGKYWSVDYNPTVVAYAGSSLLDKQYYVTEWTWGYANGYTIKAPNGTWIHPDDASRGFCASGCYERPWFSTDARCKAC
ncbi:MAG: PPC domain-containing protein [Minicystis sp.]